MVKPKKAKVAKSFVYIPLPEEFLTAMGEPWMTAQSANSPPEELGTLDVLIISLRRLPVKDAGDAERTLELLQIFKAALDSDSDYVEVRKADFDWMQTHFKEHAHKFWAAPDSAYLRKWLEEHTTDKHPKDDDSPNGVAEIPKDAA